MMKVCPRCCHAGHMLRLIALTEERGASVAWVNPDHIVSVRPVVTRFSDRARILAEIKLAGMPTERFVVDDDCHEDELDRIWHTFITMLQTERGAD